VKSNKSVLQLSLPAQGLYESCKVMFFPGNVCQFKYPENVGRKIRDAMASSSVENRQAYAFIWGNIQNLCDVLPTRQYTIKLEGVMDQVSE
jgi:hypothetical protein